MRDVEPVDVCSLLPAPRLPQRSHSAPIGGIISILLHAIVATAVMLIASREGSVPTLSDATADRQPLQLPRMVFLRTPGPSGGGGGGGSRLTDPASRGDVSPAASAKADRPAVSLVKTVVASEQPQDLPTPIQELMLEARPLASTLPTGVHDALPSLPLSRGTGFGGGLGEGTGTGIGSGAGPGLGAGSGGGFGGGAYRLGSGVVPPTLLNNVRPRYTDEALRLRIQGTVALAVIVRRDGIPGAIRVTRSLDPGGLDEEAIAAVREWRFTPGRVGDTAVDVLVTVFIDFRVN